MESTMTVPTTQTTLTVLANSAKDAASTTLFDPITVAAQFTYPTHELQIPNLVRLSPVDANL